jgi:hypothetical protein
MGTGRVTRYRRDDGAAALLTLMVAALATALGLAVLSVATQTLGAAVRARAAADAAALAAAGATDLGPSPGSPPAAAREAAMRYGVHLLSCCGDTESVPPRVRVVVAARPRGMAGRLAPRGGAAGWTAEATASLRPSGDAEASGFAPDLPNRQQNGAAVRSRR